MRLTVLALAVPVRSTTDPEPQTLGNAREALFDGGGMAGMADFDPVEPLILKNADVGLRPMITQMRGDG